jgi:large subunit ribosomal protein L20
MAGLKSAEIEIDRKVLAQLALEDPQGFSAVVARANEANA